MIEDRSYYIYEHIRLDNFTPFYIGKGKGDRAYKLERNEHHDRISEKYGFVVVIIKDGLTEEEAFKLERDTIEDLVFNEGYGINIKGFNNYNKQQDSYLTNSTWGGEGASGRIYTPTKDTIEKLRKATSTLWEDERFRDKQERIRNTKEYKEKKSKAIKKAKASEKVKNKERESAKKRWESQEYRDKFHKSRSGEKASNAKSVYCLELNKIWGCCSSCAADLKIKSKGKVLSCCNGEYRQIKGYHFIEPTEEIINFNKYNKTSMTEQEINYLKFLDELSSQDQKVIYCIELNNIKMSARQWAIFLGNKNGAGSGHIVECCKETYGRKSYKGYHFRIPTEEQIKEYEQQLLSQLPEGCFLKTFPEYIDLYRKGTILEVKND